MPYSAPLLFGLMDAEAWITHMHDLVTDVDNRRKLAETLGAEINGDQVKNRLVGAVVTHGVLHRDCSDAANLYEALVDYLAAEPVIGEDE